ncbi:MAG TPA: S-layer homology domain-containing protein [bacterium]|nr:S-layer homology domain-containing protein [bacterium]
MHRQNKRLWLLVSACWTLALVFALVRSAAASEPHWALPSLRVLEDLGVVGPDTNIRVDLDQPISPLEWQLWLGQALYPKMGPDWATNSGFGREIDTFSGWEPGKYRSILTRGAAIGGLTKLGKLLDFIPETSPGWPILLDRFNDKESLLKTGLAVPFEIMLAAGVIHGYPDVSLRPEVPLTRAEAASLLLLWLELMN